MALLGFADLSALRGLDERQRALLDLRAIYEGSRYELVTVKGEPVPALPWDVDTTAGGGRIPASRRKPMVQIGSEVNIVDRIVDLAVGEGRLPAFEVEGDPDGRLREVMLGDDDLELAYHAPDQLTDLCVVGSVPIGFSYPVDPDGFSRWESVRLESEWCEAVFAGERETGRARQLAAELEGVEGAGVESDDAGALFRMPSGIRSDDLVFLRYQWPVAEERSATEAGVGKRDVIVWHRRDYTVDAIVEYEPVVIQEGVELLPSFKPLPVEPHEWCIVPLVWLKSRGGRRGAREGASVYTPGVQTLTAAADRSASFWSQASHVSGSPTLLERDVGDDVRDARMLADDPNASDDIAVGPKSVLRYMSQGPSPDVSFLEISGEGPAALDKNAQGLTSLAYETAGVVRHDPERIKGVLSGVAMERMEGPTVARAQGYRAILGRGWRLLGGKLAVAMQAEGEPVDSEAFEISLRWPRVFKVTAADIQAWASALAIAIQAGEISRETAIGIMASLLETEDAEEEARRILSGRGDLFADTGAPPVEGEEGAEG
jgi:hypothetical protein